MTRSMEEHMEAFYSGVFVRETKQNRKPIGNYENRNNCVDNLYKFNKRKKAVFLTENRIFDIVNIIIG